MSAKELKKFDLLYKYTKPVERMTSKFVSSEFIKKSKILEPKEMQIVLDFTKRLRGDIFGSIGSYQQKVMQKILSPEAYAKHLASIGKIEYFPTFKFLGKGVGASYSPLRQTPQIKVLGAIKKMYRPEIVAHELIHLKTEQLIPKSLRKLYFKLEQGLPYRYRPIEMIAYKYQKPMATKGFKAEVPFGRIGGDMDLKFRLSQERLIKEALKLNQDLIGLGNKFKVEGTTISKWLPKEKKWAHAVDIKSMLVDASSGSGLTSGRQLYGLEIDQPSIKIGEYDVMRLSEQAIRKFESIAKIRPFGKGKFKIGAEPHRVTKEIPDWFEDIRALSGEKALDLKKLYPKELFIKTLETHGAKVPLFISPTEKAKIYPFLFKAKTPFKLISDYKMPSYDPQILKASSLKYLSSISSQMIGYGYGYPSYIPPSYLKPSKLTPSYLKPSRITPSYLKPSKTPYKQPPYKQPSYYKAPYKEPSYYRSPYKLPPYIPPPFKKQPPLKIPGLGFGIGGKKKEKKKKDWRFTYSPSLIAGLKRITAFKIPKKITGLGIRPVIRKRRKKKWVWEAH